MGTDKYFGLSSRIFRWRINTPFENWLGRKADNSEFWKRLYVLYYKIFDHKYYVGGLAYINKQIELFKPSCNKSEYDKILRDMVYCLHRFGFSFQDYWIYGFWRRDNAYRLSFVSDKLRYYYCDILNDSSILPLMTDKYACYQKYQKFFKREVLGCYNENDIDKFVDFVEKHSSMIYKPMNDHSGNGIKIISANNVDSSKLFMDLISKGQFVVEELIIQGKETAMIHPESVNSFRVVTFVIDDKVNIIGITWRIGVGSAIMDNAGSGGIYASVQPETGIVQTDAMNFKCEHFDVHPDTKIPIKGYQLPEWDDALALIKEMATNVKGTTLVSWDIAYSNKGWLMIEANDNGGWRIVQSNKRIGKKEQLYFYMDEYFKTHAIR